MTAFDQALEKLLKPQSVAIVGASETPGSVGYAMLRNLLSSRFAGDIYPINPKYKGQTIEAPLNSTHELTYLASVEELPDNKVDLAIIMTPNRTVPDILHQLGEKHLPAAVVISAGFSEIGPEGKALCLDVEQEIKENRMIVVGPNCLGVADLDPRVRMNATFAQHPPNPGKGAVFSQSGAVGIDLIERARRIGIGLSQFVSLGNEIQIGPLDLLSFWNQDPDIKFVLGYLEAGRSLAEIRPLANVMTKHTPILLIKAGRSSAGAQAAKSHTGAMAGSDTAVDALIRQTGIHRFNTITELFAATRAIELSLPAVGNRVAIFSNAGGYAVMASDMMSSQWHTQYGLQLTSFTPETQQALDNLLPKTASTHNPIDTTATFPLDDPERYQQTLKAIMDDPQVDACLVPIVPLMGLELPPLIERIAQVQATVKKPIVVMIAAGLDMLQTIRTGLEEKQLPSLAVYTAIDEAILGLSVLEKQRRWSIQPDEEPATLEDLDQAEIQAVLKTVRDEKRTLLTTAESLRILRACQIRVAPFEIATTLEDAKDIARRIGYPVALKLNSKTVTHKTEVGGVKVDIRDEAELIATFNTMMENLKERAGVDGFEPGEGIMVQVFMSRGREIILGAKADPDFGHLVLVGRGGIYAEIDKDTQFRLVPLTCRDAKEMVESIKAYRILKGYRGKPPVDIPKLEEAVLRINQLVQDVPEIVELDVNPYLVSSTEEGGNWAVDARIVIRS